MRTVAYEKGQRVWIINLTQGGFVVEGVARIMRHIEDSRYRVRFEADGVETERYVEESAQENPTQFVAQLNAQRHAERVEPDYEGSYSCPKCGRDYNAVADAKEGLEVPAACICEEEESDNLTQRKMCDQCAAVCINGVFCHESGCPNEKKTWVEEESAWVLFRDCFECGFPVREGDSCNCNEPEPEENEEADGE